MADIILPEQEYGILPPGTTDEILIELWLRGHAASTIDGYRADIKMFFEFARVPIRELKLPHLLDYKEALENFGFEPNTVARRVKSIKSLLTFAKTTGYTPFNVGAVVKIQDTKNELAERLLTEDQVFSIIHEEKHHSWRNYVLLRLMYATGARVSEICNLKWRDIKPRDETGQVTIFGKGRKTRFVLLKPETYKLLRDFRAGDVFESYVFRSRGGGQKGVKGGGKLDTSQVNRIVNAAAVRAGVETYTDEEGKLRSRVTPHWLRHAHATHSMDNGAPIALIRDTLGHKSITTTSKYAHAHPDDSSAKYLRF